jgi:hypothetical protein
MQVDKQTAMKMNEQSLIDLDNYVGQISEEGRDKIIPLEPSEEHQLVHIFIPMLEGIEREMRLAKDGHQFALRDLKSSLDSMNVFLETWDHNKNYFTRRRSEEYTARMTEVIKKYYEFFKPNYEQAIQEIDSMSNVGASVECYSEPVLR